MTVVKLGLAALLPVIVVARLSSSIERTAAARPDTDEPSIAPIPTEGSA